MCIYISHIWAITRLPKLESSGGIVVKQFPPPKSPPDMDSPKKFFPQQGRKQHVVEAFEEVPGTPFGFSENIWNKHLLGKAPEDPMYWHISIQILMAKMY